MNAVSGMDQPPRGTVLSNTASRRTFLKGAVVAGAAGLAAPLLARTSARAATEPIILGCNPGPWETSTYGGYAQAGLTWPDLINTLGPSGSTAVGCRSYRDKPFNLTGTNGAVPYTDAGALGNPIAFPGVLHGVPATRVVASIKPDPDALLNGSLDQVLTEFIANGRDNAQLLAPQLTVWHEAGHLYSGSGFSQYGLDPQQDSNGVPQNAAAAQKVRSMHAYMQDLCHDVGGVEYGCIIYGDIDKMAKSDTLDATNWVPTSTYPLDWYGIDVYYEDDTATSGAAADCTHGNLDADGISTYLGAFRNMARIRTGYAATLVAPKLNICETNASLAHDSDRPGFFQNLAGWLHNNGGHRMLTFFPQDASPTETPHSVSWLHVADAPVPYDYTIQALNDIQSRYG